MYHSAVSQCVRSLKALWAFIDKAEDYAKAKGVDIDVLLNWRLAPDMYPFIYQVQSACDYPKAAAVRPETARA